MKIKIVGTNLASLVCAYELARKGIAVSHVIPESTVTGGHFAGYRSGPNRIDLGMVLLEPRFADISESPSNYVSESGSSSNVFNSAVFRWIESTDTELIDVPVHSLFNGKCYSDFLIADGLAAILNLAPEISLEIKEQIRVSRETHIPHPKLKQENGYFFKSIEETFTENYGSTFSNFLLMLARKIGGENSQQLIAKYHRLLWLPFYYPETVLEFLERGESAMTGLTFLTAKDGGIAGFVNSLKNQMKSTGQYEELRVSKEHYVSLFGQTPSFLNRAENNEVIFFDSPLYSNLELTSQRTQISFVIYVSTDSKLPRVTHSLDKESGWFRVSESLSQVGAAIVELGAITDLESDSDLEKRALKALEELEITPFSTPEVLRSWISFPISSESNVKSKPDVPTEMVDKSVNRFISYADTRSLNNQVAMGLRASSELQEV